MVERTYRISFHDQRLIDSCSVRITCCLCIAAVKFKDDIFIIIHITGNGSVHILFNPSAKAVVAVLSDAATGQINTDQLVFRIIRVMSLLERERLCPLLNQIAVVIVTVSIYLIILQAVSIIEIGIEDLSVPL